MTSTTKLFTVILLLTIGCSAGAEDSCLFRESGSTPGGAPPVPTAGNSGVLDNSGGVSGARDLASGGLSFGGSSPENSNGGSFGGSQIVAPQGGSSLGGAPNPSTSGGASSGGAASGGRSSSGGYVSSGGASSGGSTGVTCPAAWRIDVAYEIGDVVAKNGKSFECVGACNSTPPGANVYDWLATTCDSTCGCEFGCNAPTEGILMTSRGAIDAGGYSTYWAKIETGWEGRVMLADGCSSAGDPPPADCLFSQSYTLVRCVGSSADCRLYDPRYEFCSPQSLAGHAAPCRDVAARPTSPWTIIDHC